MSDMTHKAGSVDSPETKATKANAGEAPVPSLSVAEIVAKSAAKQAESINLVLKHIATLEREQERMAGGIADHLKTIEKMDAKMKSALDAANKSSRHLLLLTLKMDDSSKRFNELLKITSCSKYRLGTLAGIGSVLDVFGTSKARPPNLDRLLSKASGFKSTGDEQVEGGCKTVL